MSLFYGKTEVFVCRDNHDLGLQAAQAVAETMRRLLAVQDEIRAVFAAGESQSSFLTALARERDIDWKKVTCFNIDDFWDPRMPEAFTCGWQTRRELYDQVQPRAVNLVKFNAADPEAECRRFAQLLQEKPIDLLCQGIGTSGHLALNEPDQCAFDNPKWVRLVSLVEQSKRQLIADPNFKALGYIPEKGITMTIPAILAARHCFTMVPLGLKKNILTRLAVLNRPSIALPASILLESNGRLFVDDDSCPDVWRGASQQNSIPIRGDRQCLK
jgi:glucosamine-6-phosphate deaminase